MIKVSVIVPVYNVEKYIERCARSLFSQTLDELEYIFVNDCSTDSSIDILREVVNEYPDRKNCVNIVAHDKNRGSSAARNTGLSIAHGKYIAYCDSDDWIEATMYECLYDLACRSKADIVYCDFYEDYGNKRVVHKTVDPQKNKLEFLRSYMNGWTVIWNLIANRDLYIKHGLVSPEGLAYREDAVLTIPLYFYALKIEKADRPLYYYNKSNSGSILTTKGKNFSDDVIASDLMIIDFFTEVGLIASFEKELAWGMLRDKQDMILSPKDFKKFMAIYPQSHKYIWSCPYLNVKMKSMMWLVVHHAEWLVASIDTLRKLLKR